MRIHRKANAGLVVDVSPSDFSGDPGVAFELGGPTIWPRPAWVRSRHLTSPIGLSTALPDFAVAAIREAIPALAFRIRGFNLPDAIPTGVERVPRPRYATRAANCARKS